MTASVSAYTGPTFPDSALVTPDEVQSGEVMPPAGATPYEVQPGDSLAQIAAAHGLTLAQLYELNPQYTERNPDLIYPNEIVFVPNAESAPRASASTSLTERTDSAAADIAQARADCDAQAREEAETEFDLAVEDELFVASNGGVTNRTAQEQADAALAAGEVIAMRLEDQGLTEEAARAQEVARAYADALES